MKTISEYNIIAIDQGNTLVKMALFHGHQLIKLFTLEDADKEGIANAYDALIPLMDEKKELYAILSSVTDSPALIHEALRGRVNLIEFSFDMPLPVNLLYQTPETLGKDRVAAACAGIQLFPGSPVLTIDAGTCITYDFTTSTGDYLGGGISPGIQMRFKALHTFTTNLPFVEPGNHVPLIGRSTHESIVSGVIQGAIQEVNGIIEKYLLKYPNVKVILTGGDTNYFDKNLKYNIFANPNLVLSGLRDIILHYVKA